MKSKLSYLERDKKTKKKKKRKKESKQQMYALTFKKVVEMT